MARDFGYFHVAQSCLEMVDGRWPFAQPTKPMNHRIAYFGHDARDAAVKRRIVSLLGTGSRVTGYTLRRGPPGQTDWANVDLGPVENGAFGRRLVTLARSLWRIRVHVATLRETDVWIARNLDMLVVAAAARRWCGSTTPLVYECLDIHRLMTRTDLVGTVLRAAEGRLLKSCASLIVSSPGFLREYFEVHHSGKVRATVIENKLPHGIALPARPVAPLQVGAGKVVIGWYGVLRCRRSLSLLCDLARRHPERIAIRMHGYASELDLPDFAQRIADLPNIHFGGRYRYPDDLASIYSGVHFVWAGDFHDAQFNSRWLLPNRLYEGGHLGVVPIAPADSETGRWVDGNGLGYTIQEPLEESLNELVTTLSDEVITRRRLALLAKPADLFVQSPHEMSDYLEVLTQEEQR